MPTLCLLVRTPNSASSTGGDVIVVRYADDAVMGFQHREEAARCLRNRSK